MKKYAFFDVDYTLYDGYLATNFNLFLVEQGYANKGAGEEEGRLKEEYLAGMIDYHEAARRALQLTADCLKGETTETVRRWQTEFISKHDRLFPWAVPLLDQMRRQGFEIYLISAAPAPPLEAVAELLKIENWFGTQFEVSDNIYTGKLKEILNYKEKHILIQSLVRGKKGLHVGFGDSLGDVDMLKAMDRAFLYSPKSRELMTLAHAHGWQIVNEKNILTLTQDL